MQSELLTKSQLEAVAPNGSRQTLPVGLVPGLSVIIHPTGKRTFSLFYRANGKARRIKIGAYPITSIADARTRAMKVLNKVADGADPARERKEARQVPTDTLEQVGADFMEKYVKGKGLRTHDQIQRHFDRYLYPRLGDRPIREITRRNVIDLVDDIAVKNGPIMARRAFSTLRNLFRWCVRRDIIPATVCSEIEMPGQSKKGTRVLSDVEIRVVWRACNRLDPVNCAYVRLLLATGQRRREISSLRRSEINEAERIAIIPASRMKGKLDHAVPLSPLAMQLIASAPLLHKVDSKGQSRPYDHVFSSGRYGDVPIRAFTLLHIALKKAVMEELQEQAKAAGQDVDTVEPMPRWTLHDLRRTCRTNLSKIGVVPEIAERVIAHLPQGVRMTYDYHGFLNEKRAALDAWAVHLMQIVSDTGKPLKLVHAA